MKATENETFKKKWCPKKKIKINKLNGGSYQRVGRKK
jgi:hypothetical protein